jgi:hypothetical protein
MSASAVVMAAGPSMELSMIRTPERGPVAGASGLVMGCGILGLGLGRDRGQR